MFDEFRATFPFEFNYTREAHNLARAANDLNKRRFVTRFYGLGLRVQGSTFDGPQQTKVPLPNKERATLVFLCKVTIAL